MPSLVRRTFQGRRECFERGAELGAECAAARIGKKTGELHSSGICIWQWPAVVSQAAVLFPFEVRGCEIGMRGRDGTGGMSSGGETEVH
jgi:hypothetical protein